MKKILFIFFIVILCCVFFAYTNSDPKIIISNLVKKKGYINTGELKYKIYLFGVLPIGETVFSIEKVEEYKGQKVYHLIATAQSLKVFSKFFSAFAVLDSYLNMEQLSPIIFRQRLTISGRQDVVKEVTYDQENGIMSIAGVKRQILPNTQDPLSAIFNLRHLDLNKTKEFEMNINTNQKNYILKGDTIHRDILVDKRTYKIILAKVDISRRDKNPYHKSKITMLLLQGKDNIPIGIKVFASGILINVKLVDIK